MISYCSHVSATQNTFSLPLFFSLSHSHCGCQNNLPTPAHCPTHSLNRRHFSHLPKQRPSLSSRPPNLQVYLLTHSPRLTLLILLIEANSLVNVLVSYLLSPKQRGRQQLAAIVLSLSLLQPVSQLISSPLLVNMFNDLPSDKK